MNANEKVTLMVDEKNILAIKSLLIEDMGEKDGKAFCRKFSKQLLNEAKKGGSLFNDLVRTQKKMDERVATPMTFSSLVVNPLGL